MNIQSIIRQLWNNFTNIDPRSYAVFRIGIAVIILLDLCISRFWRVEFFLSDTGVLPRKLLSDFAGFSLFFASGGIIWAYILLGILCIATCFMLVGYWTRLASIISYVLLLSLHWRAEFILSGADVLFLLICMWAIVLPLGSYGSIDCYHEHGTFFPKNPRTESLNERLGIIGIIFVIVCIYGVAAYVKLPSIEWYTDFTTLYYVLNSGYHTTPFGYLFRDQVLLTKLLTLLTLIIEWLLPVVILVPFKVPTLRLIFSLLIIGMHASFGLMLFISHFSTLGIVIGILFFPTFAWEYIWPIKKSEKHLKKLLFHIAKVTSSFKKPIIRSYAPLSALITIFLVYNLGVQLAVNANEVSDWEMGDTQLETMTKYYVKTLRLDQAWFMFMNAPHWAGWPEVIVHLKDNSDQDVWRLEWQGTSAVSTEAPIRPAMAFKNSLRMFNFFNKMSEPEKNVGYYPYYAFYICKQWSKHHEIKAASVEFFYNYIYWSKIGTSEAQPRKSIWKYDCPNFGEEVIDYKY